LNWNARESSDLIKRVGKKDFPVICAISVISLICGQKQQSPQSRRRKKQLERTPIFFLW